MQMWEVHDYARQFVEARGDRAEAEAAQKALECERQGAHKEAETWRRIRGVIKEMRGPHVS